VSDLISPFELYCPRSWLSRLVIPEFHLGEPNTPIRVYRRATILNIVHHFCVFVVGTTINLVQVILQNRQCSINVEPK